MISNVFPQKPNWSAPVFWSSFNVSNDDQYNRFILLDQAV